MKNRTVQFNFEEYQNDSGLSKIDQELLKAAHKATKLAYAPYSNFYVGAAMLTVQGKTVLGANRENAAYPMCMCAEQVAVSNVHINYREDPVICMAITAHSARTKVESPVGPCGKCRQILLELADQQGQDFRVILQGETGPIWILQSVKDLLPMQFDQNNLETN